MPGVPGAFLLRNLLSPAECRAMISMSEAMGYTEDAPVSLGRNIRHNENCVWIADNTLLGGFRTLPILFPHVYQCILRYLMT